MNPWRGVGLIAWNLPDDPADVVKRAGYVGARYVDVKVHDGASAWGERRHVTRDYLQVLRDAGLGVCGWGYVYCDGVTNNLNRGDGVGEWRAAVERAASLGLDGYTADFEIEAEGQGECVGRFLDSFRTTRSDPLAAFVWATLDEHDAYPAEQIVKRVDVLRPMVYRPVWAMDQFYDGAVPPLRNWPALWHGVTCPALGITAGYDDAELTRDLVIAQHHGCPGVSVWEYSSVGDNRRAGIVRGWVALPPAEPGSDAPLDVDGARARIFDAAGQLVNLGHASEGLAVQNVVKLAKGELT